ncbi:nitroreductase family deazaflavin-dependent oxidoreductase [Spirillospora sp. NPDC048911]|uniref:nitroreductase family deazaflavin-dependent oxidoreductase n=1 Tax=Spirillospora sp. NPDC048911 TaxID=3364527 RepID=UPI0037200F77
MAKPRPDYLDEPRTTAMLKRGSAVHVAIFKLTGGMIGRRFRMQGQLRGAPPVCLLTTIGRKSGQARTVPLLYLNDGERIVMVASQGGMPRHPLWYLNLRANPNVLVHIGRHRRPMRARTADGTERAELWPRLVEMYPAYDDYQSWTDREIPVVVFEPVQDSAV